MSSWRLLSAGEQVAARLREQVQRGKWRDVMPGIHELAAALGVNHKTVLAALGQLEREGLLKGMGPGRSRRIELPGGQRRADALRVGILLNEASDHHLDYMVELQHSLGKAGLTAGFARKSLTELGFEIPRVADLVAKTPADAWVVVGATHAVLGWFSTQPPPAFALFGQQEGLRLAGAKPDKPPAYAAATRRLVDLGHRRIILIARRLRRLPGPGRSERAFLDELSAHGLLTGTFNLPDWEESPEGLHDLLTALFRVTPPTALIIDEQPLFAATQQFLARQRIRVPEDVSLVCTDPDPAFAWCRPTIAHIRWEAAPIVRQIVHWATAVSRGRRDLRQTLTPAQFFPGGSIGPAPRE